MAQHIVMAYIVMAPSPSLCRHFYFYACCNADTSKPTSEHMPRHVSKRMSTRPARQVRGGGDTTCTDWSGYAHWCSRFFRMCTRPDEQRTTSG